MTADGNWDPFARDWIAAQAGQDPFGIGLAFDPDTDHDGRVAADEAFHYADTVKDPRDTPNFSQSGSDGADIALGQEYTRVPWWCHAVAVDLRPWLHRIPPEEIYARLRRVEPELSKVAQTLDRRSAALQAQFEPQVHAVLQKVFGK